MLYVSYYIARHISQINQMISAHFVYKQIVLMRRATCSLFAAWDMLETKLNNSEPDEHSAFFEGSIRINAYAAKGEGRLG